MQPKTKEALPAGSTVITAIGPADKCAEGNMEMSTENNSFSPTGKSQFN